MKITRLNRFLLSWIFEKLFRQSEYHKSNLIVVYTLIREILDEEFTEDNSPTLDSFTLECFHKTMKSSHFINKTSQKQKDIK